jgi:riboflavin kinase/FMN adenylyltransferase
VIVDSGTLASGPLTGNDCGDLWWSSDDRWRDWGDNPLGEVHERAQPRADERDEAMTTYEVSADARPALRRVSLTDRDRSGPSVVACLSAFDGVHRGHRAMLSELRRVAEARDALVGLLMVEGGVHYRARMLTALDHRIELIEQLGIVDLIWVVPDEVHERPQAVVGDALDEVGPVALGVSPALLKLGRSQQMSFAELQALCAARNIDLFSLDHVLPGQSEDAVRLFSTRNISDLLADGHVAVAGRLLGRLFEMRGEVEHGDDRGRSLGFPTANLSVHTTMLIPEEGVYAGVAITEDGRSFPAAISLGRRSTFYEDGWEVLEAHLLDFDEDIFGTRLRVLFAEHLRKQHRFASADELVAQIRIDVALVRELDPVGRYERSLAW